MQEETNPTNSKDYFVSCSWERRAETPEQIAARFWRMIDSLQRIDPVFRAWDCGGPPAKPLESVRADYAREVAEGMFLDDEGKPLLNYGYWFSAWTRDTPRNRCFVVRCHVGSTVRSVFPNSVILETAAPEEVGPDPSVIGYELFRAALLCIVEAWEPLDANAYSYRLLDLNVKKLYFPAAWIQYLCPWLAEKIKPPASARVERLADGGLLMSAATETFDMDNLEHLAVACDIGAALAPLDALPWPSEP